MMRSARTMGFAKKFKRLGRPRRYNSDDEDDEELLFSNSQNNYTANETEVEVGTGRHKKKWRSLSIGEPEQLLVGENPDCYVVFPAGIYLRIASNPNPCDMLLSFNLPGLGGGYTEVVIPSMGMVKDVEILRPAEEGAPRSQKWCELFGIVGNPGPFSAFFCKTNHASTDYRRKPKEGDSGNKGRWKFGGLEEIQA